MEATREHHQDEGSLPLMTGQSVSTPATPARRRGSDYQADLEARQRHMRRREAWNNCGVPERHRRFRMDQKAGTAWREKLEALLARRGTGFVVALLGDRGTGKTQLATELIRHACQSEDAPSVKYVRAIEIFMALKEAYRQDGPSESRQLEKFHRPRLLVIDEAHERGETDWENRMLSHLIDLRYGSLRDTLLISNLKPEAFKKAIGPSIYSRLVETGGIVECNWPSFRRATQ